jgi:hypothetical protein
MRLPIGFASFGMTISVMTDFDSATLLALFSTLIEIITYQIQK